MRYITALPFLSEDQRHFAGAIRELLEREHNLEHLRQWPAAEEHLEGLLADFGTPGLLVDPADGGLGLGATELVGLMVELGRSALALPVVDCVIGGAMISSFGDDDQRGRWLPGLIEGAHRLALTTPDRLYTVEPEKAAAILVQRGGAIYLTQTASCSFTSQPSTDQRRPLASTTYEPRDQDLLSRRPEARRHLASLGALAIAGYLAGLSARMLADAVDYARERYQFDRPVGSFQAIQHRLADTAVQLESATVACFRAAIDFDAVSDHLAASVARASCGEAARQTTIHTLQVFGGIGFTQEHHLHYWLKRAKALEGSFGSVYANREAAMAGAATLLD